MPKAQNRKKPPNQSGSVSPHTNQNRLASGESNSALYHRQDTKKQDLIERMKRIQKEKDPN